MKRSSTLKLLPVVLILSLLLAGTSWGVFVAENKLPSPTSSGPAKAPPEAKVTDEGWFAPAKRGRPIPSLPEQVRKAYVIPIREEITSKTFAAMKRKAIRCKGSGAELIILDMDTWGGQVIAALDMARLLKTDLKNIRTVCYVRTRGISAGALIALACDEIVMTRVGKLGDCAPIVMMQKLEGVEREKGESPLRAEFRESAELNGYPRALAESMVSWDVEVWLVRNKKTHELRYGFRHDWRGRVDIPLGVATAPSNPKSRWELVKVVLAEKKLLTMTSTQAQDYGFASGIIDPADTDDPLGKLREHYNVIGEPTVLTDNWSEKLVELLTSPYLVGFLTFVAILCAYVEINTPGFGIAGAVAITCVAIVFGSRFLVGLATWWEIVIVAIGIVLILVEVFVTPGFGIPGIAGILCVVVGLLAMIVPNAPNKLPIPHTDLDWSIFTNGVLALVIAFLCALGAIPIVAKYLPKVPIASRLILQPTVIAGMSPATQQAPIRSIRPGDVGITESTLRPVGEVRFGDHLVSAIAEGEFISPGTRVRVLKNEGNRVMVTPVA